MCPRRRQPGDKIRIEFCPEVTDNPSYLQVSGGITFDDEGETNETEPSETADGSDGELDQKLRATLKYQDDTVIRETQSLREMMTALENGVMLEEIYGDDYEPCIILVITLPGETGNEVQSDELTSSHD